MSSAKDSVVATNPVVRCRRARSPDAMMAVMDDLEDLARSAWSGRASSNRPWLRKQAGFGGIWIDQRDGGAISLLNDPR